LEGAGVKRLLLFSLVVAFLVGPLGAAIRFAMAVSVASLAGVVRNHQGALLLGAVVALVDSLGNPSGGDTANALGRYSIDVAPGTYDLHAIAERNGRPYVGHQRIV
jgi:hypothetical protein